ncbi:hypothetical protein MAR_027351, partial [Mya arenaria]
TFVGLPPLGVVTTDAVSPQKYVQDLRNELEAIHETARWFLKKKTEYQKRHYDITARKNRSKVVIVWVHDTSRRPGVCTKLSVKWKGPFIVTKKIDDHLTFVGLPPLGVVTTDAVSPQKYVQDLRNELEAIHETARWFLKKKTEYQKRHYDITARKNRSKVVIVWVHDTSRRPGVCTKLSVKWKGPFIVTKKIDDHLVPKSMEN